MQGPVSLTLHRINLISGLVCMQIQVRLVNLKKLACSLAGLAQINSLVEGSGYPYKVDYV